MDFRNSWHCLARDRLLTSLEDAPSASHPDDAKDIPTVVVARIIKAVQQNTDVGPSFERTQWYLELKTFERQCK